MLLDVCIKQLKIMTENQNISPTRTFNKYMNHRYDKYSISSQPREINSTHTHEVDTSTSNSLSNTNKTNPNHENNTRHISSRIAMFENKNSISKSRSNSTSSHSLTYNSASKPNIAPKPRKPKISQVNSVNLYTSPKILSSKSSLTSQYVIDRPIEINPHMDVGKSLSSPNYPNTGGNKSNNNNNHNSHSKSGSTHMYNSSEESSIFIKDSSLRNNNTSVVGATRTTTTSSPPPLLGADEYNKKLAELKDKTSKLILKKTAKTLRNSDTVYPGSSGVSIGGLSGQELKEIEDEVNLYKISGIPSTINKKSMLKPESTDENHTTHSVQRPLRFASKIETTYTYPSEMQLLYDEAEQIAKKRSEIEKLIKECEQQLSVSQS